MGYAVMSCHKTRKEAVEEMQRLIEEEKLDKERLCVFYDYDLFKNEPWTVNYD